jgi:hypothetical protein
MAGMSHVPQTHDRQPLITGAILLTIGLAALAANLSPEAGVWVLPIIGLGLLTIFLATRDYRALVPGAILTGLGLGIAAATQMPLADEQTGGVIVLGLGLGFVAVWVLGTLFHVEESHPWPLIPGGILSAIGAALLVGGQALDWLRYWPVILIVIGVVAIVRATLDRPET